MLGQLLEHDLYVKAEKCLFFKQSVSFLGYRISISGVEMESDHISAVRNWPTPTTVKEVQRFLGFANYYRRFIRGFGQVVAPISNLGLFVLFNLLHVTVVVLCAASPIPLGQGVY